MMRVDAEISVLGRWTVLTSARSGRYKRTMVND